MIVALLVGSAAAFAAPLPQGEHQGVEAPGPLAQSWHWVTNLFDTAVAAILGDPIAPGDGSGGGVTGILSGVAEGGMGMDPNGGW